MRPPMSESRPPPPPPRLSLRFATIGTLAALMVLVPLGEVLRYQTDEIQMLVAERALLDPVAHAVDVQRSLIGHGDVAGRVLAGRRQLEGERRLRQAEVEDAIHALKSTLAAGLWHRALAETDDLAHDWHDLALRILSGKVDTVASKASHRLLIEQALQVMDLVSAGAGAGASHVVAMLHPAAASQFQAGPAPADASAHRRIALDHAQAALAARGAQLHAQLGRLQAARQYQATGFAALLLTVAVALATFWQRRGLAPTGGGGDPGQRRGHGRRSTDARHRFDTAKGLIGQLRQGQPDAVSLSQNTLPPRI